MKAEAKADAAPAAGGSKMKLIVIIAVAVLVAGGGGGGAAWFFLHKPAAADGKAEVHKEPVKKGPPVFVVLEQFTVNLQPENGSDQYLQTALTLQVAGAEQEELIKANMPKVRSRLLLLLSSKKVSEINTAEGKEKLAAEIIAQVKQPFEDKGEPQEVSDVLFTSFIIQ